MPKNDLVGYIAFWVLTIIIVWWVDDYFYIRNDDWR